MAHEVFIGYSTPDKKIADAICSILEGKGIPCWIAPRDVPIGRFGGVIVEAVTQSKVMVCIFSRHSNSSANCLTEVHTAFNKGVKIIALRIDDTTPSDDMEYYLQLYHWLDAREPPIEQHYQALTDRVVKELAGIAAKADADARKKARVEEQARAGLEAEDDKKNRETLKAKREAEEAGKAREFAIKAREEDEKAKKARQALEKKKPGKSKAFWIWTTAVIVVVVVILLIIFFMSRSGPGPIITEPPGGTANETSSVIMTTNITTTTATTIKTTTTTTTPTPTTPPPLPPTEYVEIKYAATTFDKSEVTGDETFNANLSGNFTCLKDIPYPVSGLSILPKIIARNTSTGGEVTLIVSNNITAESIPLKQGETSGFMQTLQLQFPDQAATGEYKLYLNTERIKVNIGLWVDIADFFQLKEQFLGTVKYNK